MMKRIAQALIAGIRDGWGQPYEINWSTNVEHLISSESDEDSTLTWQDRGINIGQFAHAGFQSEAWKHGYWPFARIRGAR